MTGFMCVGSESLSFRDGSTGPGLVWALGPWLLPIAEQSRCFPTLCHETLSLSACAVCGFRPCSGPLGAEITR